MKAYGSMFKRGLSLFFAIAILAAVLPPASAFAQAYVVHEWNESYPLDWRIFVSCSGVGEFVNLTGMRHSRLSWLQDASGNYHITASSSTSDLKGIGEVTGNIYHGVMRDQFTNYYHTDWPIDPQETITLQSTVRLIGKGTATNFLIHWKYQYSIGADGTVHTYVDRIWEECR